MLAISCFVKDKYFRQPQIFFLSYSDSSVKNRASSWLCITWLLEEHQHVVFCLHQGSVAHRVILLQEHLDVQLEKKAAITSSPWRKLNSWVKQEQQRDLSAVFAAFHLLWRAPPTRPQQGRWALKPEKRQAEVIAARSPAVAWLRSAPG